MYCLESSRKVYCMVHLSIFSKDEEQIHSTVYMKENQLFYKRLPTWINYTNSVLRTIEFFFDFSKAFKQKFDHGVLLRKVNCLGTEGKLFKILSSYLSDRQQYVTI